MRSDANDSNRGSHLKLGAASVDDVLHRCVRVRPNDTVAGTNDAVAMATTLADRSQWRRDGD